MPQFWEDPPTAGTAKEKADYRLRLDKWIAEQDARIARQRAILARPTRGVVNRIIKGILDRAWALLDAGDAEAADALLEFVPEAQAKALLDEFFGDD